MGIGETGVGEMGVGETGPNPTNILMHRKERKYRPDISGVH